MFRKKKVHITDGSLANISGIGFVECTPMNLTLVLHVPSFLINLLSVSSITKALNCTIEFFATHCIFEELKIGRMIDSGRLQDGLYLLDDSCGFLNPGTNQTLLGHSMSVDQEIIQWHKRLGHPSFLVLKAMFPTLFKGVADKIFSLSSMSTCQVFHFF